MGHCHLFTLPYSFPPYSRHVVEMALLNNLRINKLHASFWNDNFRVFKKEAIRNI
jgi:hypothetical protein